MPKVTANAERDLERTQPLAPPRTPFDTLVDMPPALFMGYRFSNSPESEAWRDYHRVDAS